MCNGGYDLRERWQKKGKDVQKAEMRNAPKILIGCLPSQSATSNLLLSYNSTFK